MRDWDKILDALEAMPDGPLKNIKTRIFYLAFLKEVGKWVR